MPGAGAGKYLTREIYNGGSSHILEQVIRHLLALYPKMKFVVMGASLGGNVTLKFAGESGSDFQSVLGHVAVSSPLLLAKTSEKLKVWPGYFFDQYFVRILKFQIRNRHQRLKMSRPFFPKRMHLQDLDNLYTAPVGGYSNAWDYYEKCSSFFFYIGLKSPLYLFGRRMIQL